MRAKTMSSLSRAVKTIVVVWIVAGGCSIPIWIQFGVIYLDDADGRPVAESALCSIRPDMAHLQHFFTTAKRAQVRQVSYEVATRLGLVLQY